MNGGASGLPPWSARRKAAISPCATSACAGPAGRLSRDPEQIRAHFGGDRTRAFLVDELAGTENRIATARRRYNEQVQAYNTMRRQFPSNVTASIFGFEQSYPLFDAPPEAESVPQVDFGSAP